MKSRWMFFVKKYEKLLTIYALNSWILYARMKVNIVGSSLKII